ncbi:MAG: T9SS type A sorting domain-containing protein [Crocinitomicaceae bacterium]
MKNLFILCVSLFFLGNISIAQYHNTTIDYTPDTDCNTLITEAGGSYAFDIDINRTTGGWGSITQQTAWLGNVSMTYKLEFTNVATGNVEYTHVANTNLNTPSVNLDISHNMLYFSPLGDGTYTVRLFVQAIRNGNSSIPVDFRIDDLPSGQFSESTLQSNGSSIEYDTGIIFCFKYERCDDWAVSIVQNGSSGYQAVVTYVNPNPVPVAYNLTYVWTITSQDGSQSFIGGVESIPAPLECSTIEVTVTDENTGCRYSASVGCPNALCELDAPANFGQVSLANTTFFYWPAVTNANGYRVEIIFNDPECCPGIGPIQVPQIINTASPSFSLSNIRKYNCFSYRVAALCSQGAGAIGEVSDKHCYTLPSPFFLKNMDGAKELPSTVGSMSVFPNPATDQVQIELSGVEGTTSNMTIIDSRGTIVMNKDVVIESGSNLLKVSLSDFEPGVYIVRSTSSTEILTKQFVVIK